MIDITQLAYDAQISDSELAGRQEDYEILSRTNPAEPGQRAHDGYGIQLKHRENGNPEDVFIARDNREMKRAYDAMVRQLAGDDTHEFSVPSNGVPQYFTTIFNNKLIKQVLKTTPSREMTTDWQQGMFGTTNIFMPTVSYAGASQVYSDLSGQGESSVNINYVPRGTITLQRTLMYGDLTQAQMSMSKIDYVGEMRTGLAALTNLEINAINYRGFSGVNVYGLLNDPNLNPTIVAPNAAAVASSLWINKTFFEIIADVRSMYNSIIEIAGGQADYTSPAILGIPEACYTSLTKLNDLGTMTVRAYLEQTFTGLKIIQVPNYQGTGTPIGSTLPNYGQLIFPSLAGQESVYNIFSTLWNSHGVIRMHSSYEEKISYVVSGSFVALPIGIATIQGI